MTTNPLLGLLAALLPAAERDALVRRGAEPLLWSVLLGVVEFFAGSSMLISDAIAYFQPLADQAAARILEIDPKDLRANPAFGHVGAVIWLAWLTEPFTWLLASIAVTGAARLVAFGVTRDVIGEPLAWVAVRIGKAAGLFLRGSRDKLRFGPARPDRIVPQPGGGLLVLSYAPKPDWNERVTIEIDERFYRVRRAEERQDGTWWAHAYTLQEAPDNEVIRSLVRYTSTP